MNICLQCDTSKESNWKNSNQTNNNKVNSETQTETIDSGLQQDMLNGNMSDSAHSQVINYRLEKTYEDRLLQCKSFDIF